MSSVVVSSPYTADPASGSSQRRSLFKPSTWTSRKHKQEIHDGAAPAGVAPGGPVGGRADRDPVESGAPLTALTQAEERQAHPHSVEIEGEEHTDAPPPTAATLGGSSGLTTVYDSLGRVVFFRQDLPNYHLSNASPFYPVTFNSIRYPTAEHLFQALKFLPSHPEIAAKVRRAKHALDAIRIARSHTAAVRPGWISDGINVRVMHQVVLAKFSQYSQLTQALLETEDREIVNDTPSDVFWGIGGGRGRNVLGKTLMDVREVLRSNSGLGWGSGAKTM